MIYLRHYISNSGPNWPFCKRIKVGRFLICSFSTKLNLNDILLGQQNVRILYLTQYMLACFVAFLFQFCVLKSASYPSLNQYTTTSSFFKIKYKPNIVIDPKLLLQRLQRIKAADVSLPSTSFVQDTDKSSSQNPVCTNQKPC